MKTYNYIYLITNKINGKIYIGKHSTDNLDDGYMGSGILICKAEYKYGLENFTKEYLAFCDRKEKLNWLERFYIKKYNAKECGYNLTDGGDGQSGCSWNKGKHNVYTQETLLKMSMAQQKIKQKRLSKEDLIILINSFEQKPTVNEITNKYLETLDEDADDYNDKYVSKELMRVYIQDYELEDMIKVNKYKKMISEANTEKIIMNTYKNYNRAIMLRNEFNADSAQTAYLRNKLNCLLNIIEEYQSKLISIYTEIDILEKEAKDKNWPVELDDKIDELQQNADKLYDEYAYYNASLEQAVDEYYHRINFDKATRDFALVQPKLFE